MSCMLRAVANLCKHSLAEPDVLPFEYCYDEITNSYSRNTAHITGQCHNKPNIVLNKYRAVNISQVVYVPMDGQMHWIGRPITYRVSVHLGEIVKDGDVYQINVIISDRIWDIFSAPWGAPPGSQCGSHGVCASAFMNDKRYAVPGEGFFVQLMEYTLMPIGTVTTDEMGGFEFYVDLFSGVNQVFVVDPAGIMYYSAGIDVEPQYRYIDLIDITIAKGTVSGKISFNSAPFVYSDMSERRVTIRNETTGEIVEVAAVEGTSFRIGIKSGVKNVLISGTVDVNISDWYSEKITNIDVYPVTFESEPTGAAVEVDGESVNISKVAVFKGNIIEGIIRKSKESNAAKKVGGYGCKIGSKK